MRIDKTVKGEVVSFYVYGILNKKAAMVRRSMSETLIECEISNDFSKIILDGKFKFSLSGIGEVNVKYLKLNKRLQREFKDYVISVGD